MIIINQLLYYILCKPFKLWWWSPISSDFLTTLEFSNHEDLKVLAVRELTEEMLNRIMGMLYYL